MIKSFLLTVMALQQQISLRNGDYNYRNKVEKIEHFEAIWIESFMHVLW